MLSFRSPRGGSAELQYVAKAIDQGEIVCIPTDTVYGLAVKARSETAYLRLCELKGRDAAAQPTALLCATVRDVFQQLPETSERARAAIEALLPGPYTLCIANPEQRFAWLCGDTPERIGVRVPRGALALPPLAATSANVHGQPDCRSLAELDRRLLNEISCAIDGGAIASDAQPSTVIDLAAWEECGDLVILRDPAGREQAARDALAEIR